MPIHAVIDNQPGAYILYVGLNRFVAVLHSSLNSFSTNKNLAAIDLQSRLQGFCDYKIDVEVLLAQHPDDVTALNAPANKDIEYNTPQMINSYSWYLKEGPPAKIYYVERRTLVNGVVWDEGRQNFLVEYKRAE